MMKPYGYIYENAHCQEEECFSKIRMPEKLSNRETEEIPVYLKPTPYPTIYLPSDLTLRQLNDLKSLNPQIPFKVDK